IIRATMVEVHPDLGGCPGLGIRDRVLHGLEVGLAHERPDPARMTRHHQLPLAPPPPKPPPPPLKPPPPPKPPPDDPPPPMTPPPPMHAPPHPRDPPVQPWRRVAEDAKSAGRMTHPSPPKRIRRRISIPGSSPPEFRVAVGAFCW